MHEHIQKEKQLEQETSSLKSHMKEVYKVLASHSVALDRVANTVSGEIQPSVTMESPIAGAVNVNALKVFDEDDCNAVVGLVLSKIEQLQHSHGDYEVRPFNLRSRRRSSSLYVADRKRKQT